MGHGLRSTAISLSVLEVLPLSPSPSLGNLLSERQSSLCNYAVIHPALFCPTPAPVTFDLKLQICLLYSLIEEWYPSPKAVDDSYLVFWARRKILGAQVKKIRECKVGRVVRVGVCVRTQHYFFKTSDSMWIRHCARNIRLVVVELCILVHMVSCRAEGQTCGLTQRRK